MYIDKLDNIVNKYNKACYKTKPVDVKSSTYIDFSKEDNDKDYNFKVGDIVRMLKCKNIFCKRLH